ncbi:2-dehydropantoate 2-reductase [Salinisphaera sp. C84B14]|uniref:ketopantoate reductase family protein n=1 Tax=Salinisphaera sp. C84B14 TaxID=1304155 RepID=UPI0033425149
MSSPAAPHWFLAGAGHIGTLAAHYLQCAGHRVSVLRTSAREPIETTLHFHSDGQRRHITLDVHTPATLAAPIEHLIVACKTPYTANALAGCPLADDATVLRLQNGMGSLDGLLAPTNRLIETVTTNAVTGTPTMHEVVAENHSWMGDGGRPPAWFEAVANAWPGLVWADDIRSAQWRKLVANAAINPLSALYDVPNGALVDRADLRACMQRVVAEADMLLSALDADWPGDSLAAVEDVARATAANTSSMRADLQRGAVTEIDAINGWLVAKGARLGMEMPVNTALVERIRRARQDE